MILADKIILLRKEKEWSQEQLAEQLGVSRQAVSKWESAQAIPDLDKLLKMSELFGVSVDYLVKEEAQTERYEIVKEEINDTTSYAKIVSVEEADTYMNIVERIAPRIALGVALCITSPVLLIFLAGISECFPAIMTEDIAALIGICTLLIMIAVAVAMFILNGMQLSKYEYLEKEPISLAYGIRGIVEKKKNDTEKRYVTGIAIGVVLCILSVVPLLAVSLAGCADYIVIGAVCFLLFIVAVAVSVFIREGMIRGSYEKLLQEGEYTVAQKEDNKSIAPIAGVYWSLITAVYLGYSFITRNWDTSWIIWPVAGVAYGAIAIILKGIFRKRS